MRAYSNDLRERVLAFIDDGNTYQDAVDAFRVSYAWLTKLMRQRAATGDIAAKPHGGGKPPLLTPDGKETLRRVCKENADAYLSELADKLVEAGGPRLAVSTLHKNLKALGISRKKKTLHAEEQDTPQTQNQRHEFCETVLELDPRLLVFLDESGANLGMTRHFARAPRGQRAYASAPINTGKKNISTVAAIRLNEGVIGDMTIEGAFNGEAFLAFVTQILVPVLHPGDYVIMDNLGAHRVIGVREAIEGAGAHVMPLPGYSPDLDPVEPLWSFVKENLRSIAARTKEALETAISSSIAAITPRHVLAWFKHSGYATLEPKPL